VNPVNRKDIGTRPPSPVRSEVIPADYLCTWVYRTAGDGFWELKFVSALCPEHGRMVSAWR
jgi:hypothetical protein